MSASGTSTAAILYAEMFLLVRGQMAAEMPEQIEQIALLLFGSNANHQHVGGGIVATAAEFYAVIAEGLGGKRVPKSAVPEQYCLLRSVQHCLEYSDAMSGGVSSNNAFSRRYARLNADTKSMLHCYDLISIALLDFAK